MRDAWSYVESKTPPPLVESEQLPSTLFGKFGPLKTPRVKWLSRKFPKTLEKMTAIPALELVTSSLNPAKNGSWKVCCFLGGGGWPGIFSGPDGCVVGL